MINIGLPNRVAFPSVLAIKSTLPAGADVLIGMNIINEGDFAVTNLNGVTKFSFRVPSKTHIDFAEEDTRLQGSRAERRRAARARR